MIYYTKEATQKENMREEYDAVRLGDNGLLVFDNVDFKDGASFVEFTVSGGYNGDFLSLYLDEETKEHRLIQDAFVPANHYDHARNTVGYPIPETKGVHTLIVRVHYSAPNRHAPLLHSIAFSETAPKNCGFFYRHADRKNEPVRDLMADTWTFTDDLQRTPPQDARAPRKDKKVILFYFIANAQEADDQPIYDNAKILAENPQNPTFGPVGTTHYWAEPYFGYYSSKDPWVIRRHGAMLAAADVDAICLDVTNHTSYDDVILTIFETFATMRAEGNPTPAIMFMMPNDDGPANDSARHLYNLIYKKGAYRDLWFRFGKENKPLIFGGPNSADEDLKAFFEWRRNWAWTGGEDFWTWVAHTPQPYAYVKGSPDVPEEVSVSVAQHATTNIGRSFCNGKQPEYHTPYATEITTSDQGIYFKEQLDCALETDPEVMFITAFNEFTATEFHGGEHEIDSFFIGKKLKPGDPFWVDLFSPEYSRDIEPIRGNFKDNYFYQMAAGIRAFKGARKPQAAVRKTIDIKGSFSQWDDVFSYQNITHQDEKRAHVGNLLCEFYENETGRNDIECAKVACDDQNLYFYVRCRNAVSAPADGNWMTLYLNTGEIPDWYGYSYVLNRITGLLEKSEGGWHWKIVGKIDFRIENNEMMLSIPRGAVGQTEKVDLRFKWADNSQTDGNIMDFMTLGCVAPIMRFDYIMKEE